MSKASKQGRAEEEDERDEEGYETVHVLTRSQLRSKYTLHAQLADEIQDFEVLKRCILQLVDGDQPLSDSERKLFLLAFKNCVGTRRKAWRQLRKQEMEMESTDPLMTHLRSYKNQIELEIESVCKEILSAINKLLVDSNQQLVTQEKVFYLKLQGDYWRYLCEFRRGSQLEVSSSQALQAYNQARDAVQGPSGLSPCDPQLLGLALNMSVFHYEILGNRLEGLRLCRDVYQAAEQYLSSENVDAQQERGAKVVLKLLRDNLGLWENEINTGNLG